MDNFRSPPLPLRRLATAVLLALPVVASAQTFRSGGDMNLSGNLSGTFDVGGTLNLSSGTFTVQGPSKANAVNLGGTLAFDPAAGFTTATVNGNLDATGGKLVFNTRLGGDDSPTDRLVVNGATRGEAGVTVNNAGGAGAQTRNGIALIQVGGASDGVFTLEGRVAAGAYEYKLQKDANDGDWYLRSQSGQGGTPRTPVAPVAPGGTTGPQPMPMYRPEAGAYLANQAASIGMLQQQMHDRMGEPDFARGPERAPAVWTRVVRRQVDGSAGVGQLDVSSDTSFLQLGGELAAWMAGDSRFHFGAMAAAGRSDSNVGSRDSGYRAKGQVDGYSGGLYATWFGSAARRDGAYADAWVQYGSFRNKVNGDYLVQEKYDASSWSGSLEGGYSFAMPAGASFAWYVEPQLQAIYTDYEADRQVEANGTVVGSSLAGQLTTRVGVRVFGHAATSGNAVQPFLLLNWWRNDKRNDVSMDGDTATLGWPRDRYEAKLGAQLQLGGGWTGWGHAAWQTGSDGFRDIGGQVGVNYRW